MEAFRRLSGCRVVEGFVQIVLIDHATENSFANLSFPELREITHYLLLYRVNSLRSLGKLFPNLAVIRGETLFLNYALVVFEMIHLQVRMVRCCCFLSAPLSYASTVSYSGNTGFRSRPGARLFSLKVSVVFHSFSRRMPGHDIAMSHDRFIPHSFHFIVHYSSCLLTPFFFLS